MNNETDPLLPESHNERSSNASNGDNSTLDKDAILEDKPVEYGSTDSAATERDALLPSSVPRKKVSWQDEATDEEEGEQAGEIPMSGMQRWMFYIRTILLVLLVLLLFVLCSTLIVTLLIPSVAQRSINVAEIRMDELDMSEMSNGSLRFIGQMSVTTTAVGYWYTGKIDATVMQIVTDNTDNQVIGNMSVPAIELDGSGTAKVKLNSTLHVIDHKRMGELSQAILEYKQVPLHLRGTIDLLTHGIRVSNLLFKKTILIEGLNGLKKMNIEHLDLPRNDPRGGIEMTVLMNIGNPARTTLHMPALTLATFYRSMQLAELTTQSWSLYPGDNRVTFTGRMLPQSGGNITEMSRFMSSYMSGNKTTVDVRGLGSATDGKVIWLDEALRRLTLRATVPGLPGSKSNDMIKEISRMDLDLDFTQLPYAYHPRMHGQVIVPLNKLPFGFPLQINQLGLDVDFKRQHQLFAHLHVPPTRVDSRKVNETTTLLAFNISNNQLDALPNKTKQFEMFMTAMLLQPAVNMTLVGSSTVGMSTAVGALTISALPIKLTNRLVGMNGFRNSPLSILQLSIEEGTKDMLTLGMTVVMINPTSIRCRFPWMRLAFGPQANTTIGEVVTSMVDLTPGNTTLAAQGRIALPRTELERQVLARFFTDYLTQEQVTIHVQGHQNATSVPSLAPALQQLQLTGQLSGLRDEPLLRRSVIHILFKPSVTLTMYNPIPGVNITLWEVEATVIKDNLTIGGNQWKFSDNATTGLPPPIELPPRQEVTADRLPVKASSDGYKLIRDAVGGQLLVDVNITTSVTLGQFPLTMSWIQSNVTIDVNWF